jgi:hypothetical protein
MTDSVVDGTIHSGRFDMIALNIVSASLTTASNETTLALSTERYVAIVPLVIKSFSDSTITIQFSYNISEMIVTHTLNLKLEATAMP